MELNLHLLAHNILSIASVVVLLGVGLSAYLNGRGQTANKTFALTMLAATVFAASHVIGTNIANPELSRIAFMFNLSTFFISAFSLHTVYAYLDKEREKHGLIVFTYSVAIAISILFLILPDLFLLPSVPKMYFPNYYNPGVLNWVRLVFMYGFIVPYILYDIFFAYVREKELHLKNQHLYFLMTIIVGYTIGFIPNFLVYDMQIDPLWGMAFGALLGIPFAFGAVRYQLFNIRVIAKQALLYSIAVAILGGFIALLNYSNQLVEIAFPGFPTWIAAITSSMLIVTASVFVWRRLRESDILKYEFINIITHKFRTPMTYIKFSVDELRSNPSDEMKKAAVDRIEIANNRLIELTNVLVETSQRGSSDYTYTKTRSDLNQLIEEALYTHRGGIAAKFITVKRELATDLPLVTIDTERTKSVLQILIENAVMYSHKGGTVTIQTKSEGGQVVCAVHDEGMGIAPDEMRLIFNKFYRSTRSAAADTEGIGMGLFIAKNIVEQQGGKLWMASRGKDLGSTFFLSFPSAGK